MKVWKNFQKECVLAGGAVPLPDVLRGEFRAALRHAGVVRQHEDRRRAHRSVNGLDAVIPFPHRQREPLRPFHGAHAAIVLDVERGRGIGGHHTERLGGRLHVNGLPVAVQHQYRCFIEYVIHG